MRPTGAGLAGHPDRDRWNSRYSGDFSPSFAPHPLAAQALSLELPAGPVADLACGPSGSALLAAGAGRAVTAVDVSEVALALLSEEARRRHLDRLITLVHADLAAWRPDPEGYALVLCTGYWDRALLDVAAAAARPGGLLGWEAFTTAALRERPGMNPGWCLGPGEPASLLPADFRVLDQADVPGAKRRLLARRAVAAPQAPGHGTRWRASGATQRQRCPGAGDRPAITPASVPAAWPCGVLADAPPARRTAREAGKH